METPHPLLSMEKLGMGSSHTWHEIPDARIRAMSINGAHDGDLNVMAMHEGDCTSSSSDGDTVVDVSQLIALGMVSSFTEHNLRNTLNPMVPSVLINSSIILICLYDCVSDLLLITSQVQLVNFNETPLVVNVPVVWLL